MSIKILFYCTAEEVAPREVVEVNDLGVICEIEESEAIVILNSCNCDLWEPSTFDATMPPAWGRTETCIRTSVKPPKTRKKAISDEAE